MVYFFSMFIIKYIFGVDNSLSIVFHISIVNAIKGSDDMFATDFKYFMETQNFSLKCQIFFENVFSTSTLVSIILLLFV